MNIIIIFIHNIIYLLLIIFEKKKKKKKILYIFIWEYYILDVLLIIGELQVGIGKNILII